MPKSKRRKQQPGRRHLAAVHSGPGDELADVQHMLAAAGAPPELLNALASEPELRDMVREMLQAEQPSPEDALAGLLDHWAQLLGPGTHQLQAELCGADFLAMLRAGAHDEADLPDMLAQMIKQAEASGRPEALALLRVLAVLGPEQVRRPAADAADRLVAAGLADPLWVPGLGTPKAGPGFGYTDFFGAQEALVLTFGYGRKRHAFGVLIDHNLGGGVKDCFVTDKINVIRTKYRQAADAMGVAFNEFEPAQARAVLEQALCREPCPVAPDQVRDVGAYLDLLRSRVALLPTAGSPAQPGEPRRSAAIRTVHRVKITLRGSKPPIWRRLEVPSETTLEKLHAAIQAAFGWSSCHLWVFETPLGEYGIPDQELGHRSAASNKLSAVAARAGDHLRYTYDFGDDWEHDIAVEEVLTAEPGVAYPRCLTGRRAGPPEDCGGIWGYEELCTILANPDHPEHQDMLEWLGLESAAELDPARLDLDEVNRALSRLATVVRKR